MIPAIVSAALILACATLLAVKMVLDHKSEYQIRPRAPFATVTVTEIVADHEQLSFQTHLFEGDSIEKQQDKLYQVFALAEGRLNHQNHRLIKLQEDAKAAQAAAERNDEAAAKAESKVTSLKQRLPQG